VKTAAFVGFSNTGKTTLLESLTAELKRRGRRVAVVKRCPHGFDFSPEGKDAARYLAAGADCTLVLGPDRTALLRREEALPDPQAAAASYFPDADFVLIEGGKNLDAPLKIEIVDPADPSRRVLSDDEVSALVSEREIDSARPVFRPGEVERLADFLEAL